MGKVKQAHLAVNIFLYDEDDGVSAAARIIADNSEMHKLLKLAKCPCCTGDGVYYDEYGVVCQCQWCDERDNVLKRFR